MSQQYNQVLSAGYLVDQFNLCANDEAGEFVPDKTRQEYLEFLKSNQSVTELADQNDTLLIGLNLHYVRI